MRQREAEIWKGVVGHEDRYEVSSLGRVRSKSVTLIDSMGRRRPIIGKVLCGSKQSTGYRSVEIAGRTRHVHALVAEAFIGPRPDGLHVLHRNGAKLDCREENLRYGTPLENNQDSIRHGVIPMGERHQWAKVNDEIVAILRALVDRVTANDLGRTFGISGPTVRGIQKRLKWRHVTAVLDTNAAMHLYERRRNLIAFRSALPIAVAALEMRRG